MNKLLILLEFLPVLSFLNSESAEVNPTCGPPNRSRSIAVLADKLLANSLLLQEHIIQLKKYIYYFNEKGTMTPSPIFFS